MESGIFDNLDLLLKYSQHLDFSHQDIDGNTAYHMCLMKENFRNFHNLFQHSKDSLKLAENLKNRYGMSLFDLSFRLVEKEPKFLAILFSVGFNLSSLEKSLLKKIEKIAKKNLFKSK